MELTNVESSHIAAIGYLEAERVLLVRFREGGLYAWANFSPTGWIHFQAAQSKGKFLAACKDFGSGVLIAKGVMPTEPAVPSGPTSAVEPGGNAAPSPVPLNVIDEDADKCCRAAMDAFNLSNLSDVPLADGWKFNCPKCGMAFAPEMVGPTRFWRIVPAFAIHRKP